MSESDSKAASLARIRENQRRSRARKKEYVHELEEKYRLCDAVGVTATAEVQAAARKVVAENKILRQLLRERGVSDADIDQMLLAMQIAPGAPQLEGLIERRWSCNSPGTPPRVFSSSADIMRSAPAPAFQPHSFSTDTTDTLQPIFQPSLLQSNPNPLDSLAALGRRDFTSHAEAGSSSQTYAPTGSSQFDMPGGINMDDFLASLDMQSGDPFGSGVDPSASSAHDRSSPSYHSTR